MQANKKSHLDIEIEQRTAVVYTRVKPSTRQWLEQASNLSGAKSMGEFLDALIAKLREEKRYR
jgi:hypothetical protein